MLLVMIGASVLTSSAFVVNKQQSMNRVVSHGEQITAIGAWWNNDWYYRKPLTIDHTKVVDDLENFSILVHYQSSDIAMHAQSDEDDFVFTTADGIKLNHEIETYNASSGELVAWVNITHLSSTVDYFVVHVLR